MNRELPPLDLLVELSVTATTIVSAATGADPHREAETYFAKWRELIRAAGYDPPENELKDALHRVAAGIKRTEAQDTAANAINRILPEIREARERLLAIDGDAPGSAAQAETLLAFLIARVTEVRRLEEPYPALQAGHDFSWLDELRTIQRDLRSDKLESERDARLERRAAERPVATVVGGRTCSACGRREARVDALCKRCAHAAGTRPRGKIGSG